MATDDLRVNFLRSAAQGTIVGRAEIVSRAENRALVEGHLRDRSGELVAAGAGMVRLLRPKETKRCGPS
jgi:acyl-coenzyme A thioesterase PaaI-like protein